MDISSDSVRHYRQISYPIDCLLFDLNDTLYSSEEGIGEAFEKNIEDFLVEKCGFAEDNAPTVRLQLFRTYGTTLAGLQALGYDIDADDYHNFVHGRLPYEFIKQDLQLRNVLQSIKQRKLVFTNSRRNHAIKILERLGLQDCFDQIICFEILNSNLLALPKSSLSGELSVVMKPSIEAMKIALDFIEVDPHRTLFLDDDELNIAAGKAVGFRTVLVGKQVKSKEADFVVQSLADLRQVVPEIWV
ncbi:HAD-like domain [Macleaya cordata]|uniref:HAD-like domain n=1 Tax=Macleaya cordata TaxID=56857 RepID=A0A200QQ51_MACCD|nr:HAD-like domain [Macleaya cordata]